MEFVTGNEGRIPQWRIEAEILRATHEVIQSQNPQERLIGLMSAQTLNNKGTRRSDNNFDYYLG